LTFIKKNWISLRLFFLKKKKKRNPMSEIQIDLTLTFNIPDEGLNVNGLLFGLKNSKLFFSYIFKIHIN